MSTNLKEEHWLETYKSLITVSMEGFRFSALANGGAAVTLLAYLGNVAGKDSPTPDMRFPMAAFLAGLFCCGLAMLCSYITQLKLLNERSQKDKSTHRWPLYFAIHLFALSIILFGVGSWQAVKRFH